MIRTTVEFDEYLVIADAYVVHGGDSNKMKKRSETTNQCGKIVNDYLKETYPNPEGIRKYTYLAIPNLHFEIDNHVKNRK